MSSFHACALLFLLSSRANRLYKYTQVQRVESIILANRESITKTVKKELTGAVLVTGVHTSASDIRPHLTVDLYGVDEDKLDEPVGTAHVYDNDTVQAFDRPRAKASAAYEKRKASYKAAAAARDGKNVIEYDDDDIDID